VEGIFNRYTLGIKSKGDYNMLNLLNHQVIITLTIVLMALGILCQVSIGVIYQRLIHDADTLSGVDSKLLTRCKERFINCYKLNGGVANISVFVDKYINRLRILGMSVNFIKHLSGQIMLGGVFMAGFGVCKGIVEGRIFVDLLPFYIISLFGIYLYLSVMSMVDMPAKRNALKVNLVDYLENTVAKRLEQGIADNQKLLWEIANNPTYDDVPKSAPLKEDEGFSTDDARELEELLKTIIGN
jgi:hypothetical protein